MMQFENWILRIPGAPDAHMRDTQQQAERQAAFIAATNRQRKGVALWLQGGPFRADVPVSYYTPKDGREYVMGAEC